MTERGRQLHETADGQIAELIALIATVDEAALHRPCPGREKLGDGTVGASVRHTADNYQRIASFVETSDRISDAHAPTHNGAHRIPRFLRTLGHGPADHAAHGPGVGQHDVPYTADNIDQAVVVEQLSAARDALERLAQITDRKLDTIPPDGSFRFCDGQRTLEQVLAGLFKHQGRQLDALKAATP